MKFSIAGNPHVVHEACHGFSKLRKIFKLNKENYRNDIKLCTEWLSMISLFPHARLDEGVLDMIEYLLNSTSSMTGKNYKSIDKDERERLRGNFFKLLKKIPIFIRLYFILEILEIIF
jgi:hypothetical protein